MRRRFIYFFVVKVAFCSAGGGTRAGATDPSKLPAGHIDYEPARSAVIREAWEETGILLDSRDVKFLHVMFHRDAGGESELLFFEARRWVGDIENKEPDKCGGWRWYPADSLPVDLPCLRHALDRIKHGDTYSEYGW